MVSEGSGFRAIRGFLDVADFGRFGGLTNAGSL
jgi:hypothetical protein